MSRIDRMAILGGVARFIHYPDRHKFFWIHLVWIWYVFIYLLFFWWSQLWMNTVEEWNTYLYGFLVLYSVLLYLLCVIITPPDSPRGLDLREFFFSMRNWFSGVVLATSLVDILDSVMKNHIAPAKGGYLVVPLIVIALLTKNTEYHAVLALLSSVGLTVSLFLGGGTSFGVR